MSDNLDVPLSGDHDGDTVSVAVVSDSVDHGGAKRSAASEYATGDLLRIGPSRLLFFWLLIVNPSTWIAVALMAFAYNPHFREFIYNTLSMASAQRGLIDFYKWQKALFIPLWFWPLLISMGYAYTRIKTTHYLIDDGVLSIKYGLLGFDTPAGPFVQYTDSIAVGLILDVDLRRGPIELLLGTGSLLVRSRVAAGPGGYAKLKHVPQAERVRNRLLDQSPAKDARVIISG